MKRGFYEVEYELVTNESSKSKHGEITEKFTKMIEADIVKNPEYWLWSHKRWKHKKPQTNN
jgi:KDO2-lipid IV(A) lauroyltransferase